MIFTEDDISFLEGRPEDRAYVNAGFIRGLTQEVKEKYADMYRRGINNAYKPDLGCPECVMKIIQRIYLNYDSFKAKKALEEPKLTIENGNAKNPATTTGAKKRSKK